MKKRALVIAVTRLGDLIQTEPMLRALKRSGSVDHVTVLIEKSFRDIASVLVGADEVHEVDFGQILGRLDLRSQQLPLEEYVTLAAWLKKAGFTNAYNVTHSRPSMMLAALAVQNATGVTLDTHGMQVVNNRWLQYFFATNLARPWCSFNLIDIYVNAVDPSATFNERKPQINWRSAKGKSKVQTLSDAEILLHVGASNSDKQWPLDRFVQLANALLNRGARVTLIGGQKSKDVSEAFPADRSLKDCLGLTTIHELFELCAGADLLVSADSGPVHVAAACGLQIITIEGGSAHGFETAPYAEGMYVVQPHLDDVIVRVPNKKVSSGSAALVLVKTVLSIIECHFGSNDAIEHSPQTTVYRTRAGKVVPGLELHPVSGAHCEFEEWQQRLRSFWWKSLNLRESSSGIQRDELSVALAEAALAARNIRFSGINSTALDEYARGISLAEHKLTELIQKHPPLHHINGFLQIARSSLTGETAQEQAHELEELYDKIECASNELFPARQSALKSRIAKIENRKAVA